MDNKESRAPLPNLLLIALGLSILTLPLVLLFKVSAGSSQFSISYLFICAVFGWTGLAAVHQMSARQNAALSGAALLPTAFLTMAGLFTAANGVDAAFLMGTVFWVSSTYLGILLGRDLAISLMNQMCAIALFASILGIVLYIFNFPLLDLETLASDMYFVNDWGHYRAASIFLNPNSFAYFLLFAFSVYFFQNVRTSAVRIAAFGCVLVAFTLTSSRSAFLASGVLLLLRLMIPLPPRARFIAYSAVNIVLLSLLVTLVVLSEYLISSDVRFEKWAFSIDIFMRSPEFWLTGMPASVQLEKLGMFFSDNMFLSLLFRLGAFGFAGFVLYYAYIIWRAMSCLVWGDPVTRPFAAFLIACSVLLFYSNFFYFYPLVLLHGVATGQVLRSRRNIPSPIVNIKAVQ